MAYRKHLPPPTVQADEPHWLGNSYDVSSRMVRAAWKLVFTRDPATLSLRDVALEVGVATSSTYYHFKRREELFYEIAWGGLKTLARDVSGIVPDDATRIERGLVPDLCKVWLRFAEARPRHYAHMFSREFTDPVRFPHVASNREQLRLFLRLLVETEVGFELPPGESDILLAQLHGAACLIASGEPSPPPETLARAISAHLEAMRQQHLAATVRTAAPT